MAEIKYMFTVYGEPYGKTNMIPTRRGNHLSLANPTKNKNYMSLVQDAWLSANVEKIPDNYKITLQIVAHFQIPKATSKRKHALMLQHLIKPTKRPDCDNISKVICDALNGLAFYDDSMVTDLFVSKRYGSTPRTEIYITGEENE